ncbi:MAG: hypothetical protein U1F43_31630 [Myxococcota bacterium]
MRTSTLQLRLATFGLLLASAGCAAPHPRPDAATDAATGGPAASCDALAAHAREVIAEARSRDPSLRYLPGAEGPFGACLAPADPRGSWALTLDDFKLTSQDCRGPAPGKCTLAEAHGALVYVETDGRVIASGAFRQLNYAATYDDSPDASPFCVGADDFVCRLDAKVDWTGDGVLECALESRTIRLAQLASGRIEPFAEHVLPTLTDLQDIDGDGLLDLIDEEFWRFDPCDGSCCADCDDVRPLALVAHALRPAATPATTPVPDGDRFATSDPVTREFYRRACRGVGEAPWVRAELIDTLRGIACARLHGAAVDDIDAALERALKERVDDEPAGLPTFHPDALWEWVARAAPIQP